MKKIASIRIKKLVDEDSDPSWLGTYDMTAKSEYAISTFKGPRAYPWFNPPIENYKGEPAEDIRRYARQDYQRMEGLNNQEWYFLGIRAEAEIRTSENGKDWLINHVSSGGLWGIESDSGEAYFKEVGEEEMENLKVVLKELGFTDEEINAVEVQQEQ